jgi:cobalt-zinc-cadmium efflux system outer membrane protein
MKAAARLILIAALTLSAGGAELSLSDGVSPGEAVALALERNPQLSALRQRHAVAASGVTEAKALADPELRMGRLDFDDEAAGNSVQNYNLALRWSPPRPGERGLKGAWAQGRVSEVDGEIAAAEQKLAAEVRLLHMNLMFLDEQIKLAEAAVQVRERIVALVASQVEAGVKTARDQNVAELALADARLLPDTYQADRRVAGNRLASELGLLRWNGLTIQVDGEPLVFRPRSFDQAGLVEIALANRPELVVLSARRAQAETLLKLRKRERYPWLSFVQLGREFRGAYGLDRWGFRFGIGLPILQWTRGSIQRPAAELEQRRLEVEALQARIRLEVEELVERLRSRGRELEDYRESSERLGARAVELAEQAVAAGEVDQVQRLTADARRLSQEQTYLSKLRDYRRLEIELDQALGSAIPH